MLAALFVTGCGSATTSGVAGPTDTAAPVGVTIELAAASFVQTTATIAVGQGVQFNDPAATGGPHMLCLGHNQVCDTTASGPQILQGGGFRIMPGSPKVEVVFPTPGTYDITCSLHPLMNLVVTVR